MSDTEFMNELEAAVRLKPSRSSNAMLASVTALVLFFLVWANISKIEELTRGQGQVVPSSAVQVVQSLEGGILQELLVSEGDLVKKNQVLMRLSDVAFSSEERGTEAQFLSLKLKKARLTAEANGTPFTIPDDLRKESSEMATNEESLHASRQKELANALSMLEDKIAGIKSQQAESQAQISRMGSNAVSLRQELEITRKMVEQKAVPKLDQIKLERELSDTSGQSRAEQQKLQGLKSELAAAEKERGDTRDKFRTQALGELGATETQIKQLGESLKSIGDRVDRSEIRSPVDGIVNNIAVKTVGGVIEHAQKLVEIVPVDDELKILAKVLPQDIAFIKIGQPVNIKISAYDPQRYGSLKGHLTRIGANSVPDHEGNIFFEIEVRTDQNHLGTEAAPLPITPGMVATTEIITGKRSIMEYLMKPVLRLKDNALRER